VAEVLLFHHALGLTAGCVAFADRLRDGGHVVHTPDLFEGRTFPSVTNRVRRRRAFSILGARWSDPR
jgi:dienelactone hydrolase